MVVSTERKMLMKPTIKDIARESGYSIATVSRVLSNKKNLSYSPETAKKIRNIAQQLGYHRNNLAAALVSKKNNTIAVIVNSTHTSFSWDVLSGIQKQADESGYSVIILYAGNHNQKLAKQAIDTALERDVSGILLVAMELDEENTDLLRNSYVPYRFVSNYPGDQLTNYISSDNHLIGQMATEYLIKQGHKKIAIVGLDDKNTANKRLEGYKLAMKNANLPINEELLYSGDYSYEDGKQIIQKLAPLIKQKQLTAIIAASDMVGTGLIKAAQQNGIKVPDDLSVISIDGTFICEIISPAMTSITQDFKKIGATSVTNLLKHGNSQFIPIKIVERESVKKMHP